MTRTCSIADKKFITLCCLLVFLVSLTIVGCKGQQDPRQLPPEKRIAFARELYQRDCAACHGEKGDGNGKEADRLETKPTAFTAGKFKFKSTPSGQLPLDKDIFRSIANGVRTTAMLPQAHLSEGEIWVLVEYIKTFHSPFESQPEIEPILMPSPPPRTQELIDTGRQMFKDAGCVQCHGPEGRGDGSSAGDLTDSRGLPIQPSDLTYLPRKVGPDVTHLYRVIQTGMEGTPMPSYQIVLTDEQTWALAYYLDSIAVNQHPTGMMGLVGEEVTGMHIDMRAARALMRRGRGMGRGRMMGDGMMKR